MLPEGFLPPEGAPDFRRMLQNILAGYRKKLDEEYELLGPLSENDRIEWAAINSVHSVLGNKVKALQAEIDMNDARRKAFWAKIEADTGIYDKNMRIEDDINLLVAKDKPHACDGDCQSCPTPDEPSPEDE